jgi:hypothetical protein
VIEAESQVMLIIINENDFQDAFKNDRSAENVEYARRRTTSRVILASGPKVSLWKDGSTSPGNYG